MAATMDGQKMNAKFFGANANSTVCETYKMLKTSTEKLGNEFEGARAG